MKRWTIGMALILIAGCASAQIRVSIGGDRKLGVTRIKDTTVVKQDTLDKGKRKKGNEVILPSLKFRNKKASFGIGFGFDFGWNRFMENGSIGGLSDPNLKLKYGPNFTFNFLEGRVDLISSTLRLKTALGLDWNTYHFKRDIVLEPDKDKFSYHMSDVSFSKNLLRSRYLRMPLMLVVRPVRDSGVEISLGVEGGILLNAKTKQISSEHGEQKVYDDFNLNPYRFGYQLRIGYSIFNMYARYYSTEVFDQHVQGAPGMRNVVIGISLGGI